ncbi:MAG: hypothetical protein P1U87_18325 [Verrucomicrobiales bacterium]|nr:hypothetical protein [Verrucomicrobiales bacterium]
MAIRLGESISHGTIDNSVKGVVTGELLIEGFHETVQFNLKGNAHPDIAGRILKFRNPSIEMLDPYVADVLEVDQSGFVGDMSVSQKRRVLMMPIEEITNASPEEREAGTIWKKVLFLEWFNPYNGRLVIEAVDYIWELDDPRWELSDDDIAEQVEQSRAAMNMHLNFAVEVFQETNEEIRAAEEEIDPNANDEFSWEKRLHQSDRRAGAFHALMEEARNPKEMETLAEMAYGDREEEDFSPEPPDFSSGRGEPVRDEYTATPDVLEICSSIQALCKGLIENGYEEMIGLPEQGEFLSLMVKSQTVADMTVGDQGAGFERGFLIAHAKREIARSQRIIADLEFFNDSVDGPGPMSERLWKLRSQLVDLAGHIRD